MRRCCWFEELEMNDAQPVADVDPLDLEGLEPVFHDEQAHGSESFPGEPEAMKVTQAAELLEITARAVLRMIKTGDLCATKDRKTGEWILDGHCVRAQLCQQENSKSKDEIA